MSILLLIVGLLLFVGLVVVHEFGHFMAARRNKVEVEEFGIGFPPRAWHKKLKNGTLLTFNWLPIGGFVKLKGENDADDRPGSFGAASTWSKAKIMLAGVAVNGLVAFLLFTLLAAVGIPRLIDNQFTVQSDTRVIQRQVLVGYVEPGSPAAQAGLQPRDRLLAIGPPERLEPIASAESLPELTKKNASNEVTILFKRAGATEVAKAKLRSVADVAVSQRTANPKGILGVAPTEYVLQRSTWSAPLVGAGIIGQFTSITFKGLGSVIAGLAHGNTGQATAQVAGPVGIVVLLKDGSLLGLRFVLMIIAIISLTLAIMNALPIPALDGGRLFVMLLFRAARRPLGKRTEDFIHGTGFALLMLLFVLITVVDIRRFF